MLPMLTLFPFPYQDRKTAFAATAFLFCNFFMVLYSNVVISGTLRHKRPPVNEVMLMKGHVTLIIAPLAALVAITSLS